MFQSKWFTRSAPLAVLTAGFVAFGAGGAYASAAPDQTPDQTPGKAASGIERSLGKGVSKRDFSLGGQNGMPGGGGSFGPADLQGTLKASRNGVTVKGYGKGCAGAHGLYASERGSVQGAGSGCANAGGGTHLGTDGASGSLRGGGTGSGGGRGEVADRSAGGGAHARGEASGSAQGGGPQGSSGELGGEGQGGGSVTGPDGNSRGGSVSTDDLPTPTHVELPPEGGELPSLPGQG